MPSDPALLHFNRALDFESQGRCSEAAASYREAIRNDPMHVRALLRLGLVLRDLGRDEEANAAFATALRLHSAGLGSPAAFAIWPESAAEESATIAG
jgi:Flp pilus assembly protein TadD